MSSMSSFRVPRIDLNAGPEEAEAMMSEIVGRARDHLQESSDALRDDDSEEAKAHTLQALGLMAYALLAGAVASGD